LPRRANAIFLQLLWAKWVVLTAGGTLPAGGYHFEVAAGSPSKSAIEQSPDLRTVASDLLTRERGS
jgi:hypothetical protein